MGLKKGTALQQRTVLQRSGYRKMGQKTAGNKKIKL